MAFYENVFIARQDISPAQVDALVERFTGIVGEGGGTVAKHEYWGLRNLTFRIKKNRKGHYVMLHMDAPAPVVDELERNMRIDEDVLRFQTVRLETVPEGQSAMMQKDRGERRGPRDREFGGRGDRDFGGRGDRGDRGERGEREFGRRERRDSDDD